MSPLINIFNYCLIWVYCIGLVYNFEMVQPGGLIYAVDVLGDRRYLHLILRRYLSSLDSTYGFNYVVSVYAHRTY